MNRQKTQRTSDRRRSRRIGVALLDVVVAASLVVTTLAIATPLVIGSARTWKETRDFQIAIDELSAQLDRLIALPDRERKNALASLEPSDSAGELLIDATLTSEVIKDNDGTRIVLAIDWRRIGDPPPVRLVGWTNPIADEANSQDEDAKPQREQAEEVSQ